MKLFNPATLIAATFLLVTVAALHESRAIDEPVAGLPTASPAIEPAAQEQSQEYYELRIYQVNDFEKQAQVEEYLKTALMPALGRQGIDRIGVFTDLEDFNDHSMFVIIPYKTLDAFSGQNAALAADTEYQKIAATYFEQPLKDPLYTRIESRLMKAFAGIPTMEIPSYSEEKTERLFELRLYESHTEWHAAQKVKMFNDGEIQIMRDTQLAPVFFGETLIGPDAPNLIYMLSASDAEAHGEHWKAFIDHPEWIRIKDLPEYKDTVSNIRKWMLTPTAYSQL